MVVADSPLRLQYWLDGLGFKRGNPFELSEAGKERSLLPEYYTDVTGYDEAITSPQSGIFTAPRGGGKTALRIMAATQNAPTVPTDDTFAVEYTQFDTLLEKYTRDEQFYLADHQKQLLNACAKGLWSLFCGSDQDDEATSNQRYDLADTVSHRRNIRLATFLKIYAPELFNPLELQELFFQLAGSFEIYDWISFTEAIRNERLTTWIANIESLRYHPTVKLIAQIVDQPPNPSQADYTITSSMAEVLRIAKQIGFNYVMILIDGVDEYDQTTNDLEIQAKLVEPLINHLPLMEMPGVAFKFFILTETYDIMLKRGKLRLDRGFHSNTVQVAWDEKKLRNLLRRRLAVFSLGRVLDLAQICQGSSGHIARYIEDELIKIANNSPRNLLIAGKYLLESHINRYEAGPFLETVDWETAYSRLIQNGIIIKETIVLKEKPTNTYTTPQTPILHISSSRHCVSIGEKEIKTTPTSFRILESLARSEGNLHRDHLAEQVWRTKDGVTNETIDRAIGRLRESLDDDKSDPKYIETVRGWGFRLLNFEYED